jgi:Domain of unknown function (DUF4148)
MKTFIQAIAVIAVLATPVASFAQSSQPMTRAEVREQLVQAENAGYTPGATDAYAYPQNMRAAEAIVAAQNGAPQNTSYGSSTNGQSQSGTAVKN